MAVGAGVALGACVALRAAAGVVLGVCDLGFLAATAAFVDAFDGAEEGAHLDVLVGEFDADGFGGEVREGEEVLSVGLAVEDGGDVGGKALAGGAEGVTGFFDGVGVATGGAGASVCFEVVEGPEFGGG